MIWYNDNMTSKLYTDHSHVYTATDSATTGASDENLYTIVSNAMAAPIDSFVIDSTSAVEIPQPAPVIVSLQIETCKYDADGLTLFAFTQPRDTLSYPQTQPSPDELRLTRIDKMAGTKAYYKEVIKAPRVIPAPTQPQILDDTYSLYRDEDNDAWVRLYESEKLRDYYFALYRATKKNPYP